MSEKCPKCGDELNLHEWTEDTEWGGSIYHVYVDCQGCGFQRDVYETENSNHLETFYEYGVKDRAWDELTLTDFEGRENDYFKMLGEDGD